MLHVILLCVLGATAPPPTITPPQSQVREAAAEVRKKAAALANVAETVRLGNFPISYRKGRNIDLSRTEIAKRAKGIERWATILEREVSVVATYYLSTEAEALLKAADGLDRELLDLGPELSANERLYDLTLTWGTAINDRSAALVAASGGFDAAAVEYFDHVDEALRKSPCGAPPN